MASTFDVLLDVLNTYVEPAFPGTNSLAGYYDATTLTPVAPAQAPAPTSWLLYWVAQTVLNMRSHDAQFKIALTDAEVKDLYSDIANRLSRELAYVDAVIADLDAHIAGL